MRITRIQINKWRNFEDVEIQLNGNMGLVCLVGANGTGKSHLLELIAACSHNLGLSAGIDNSRGNPFDDEHDFSLEFTIEKGSIPTIEKEISERTNIDFTMWNRTLKLHSYKSGKDPYRSVIRAGGITNENDCVLFAQHLAGFLQLSKEVHFLSLDANRAYPKKNININELAQAYQINWEDRERTRGRSYRSTYTLYDEWIKYFLAQENQRSTQFTQQTRRARELGQKDPVFVDFFDTYKQSLQEVLPHLVFTGIDPQHNTILFDTPNVHLSFDQLSGGEREIAFLIGQIERFGLQRGLFLIDEPELHLNSDLIRTWVSYLTSTVETGQVWLATHSLEAIEVAGPNATFILEKNDTGNKVDSIRRLDNRPVLSLLSRAVGSPAFSISQLSFVFIEGIEVLGERERFRKLAGEPRNVRFIEGGSCNEILQHVETIKRLAQETESGIRIGGIVDRDFRSVKEANTLFTNQKIFVLPVHEVENFFLHPKAIQHLLIQNGVAEVSAVDLIRKCSDSRAGSWIFQYAFSTSNARELPKINANGKEKIKKLNWQDFDTKYDATIQGILELSGYNDANQAKLRNILKIAVKSYAKTREAPELWQKCEGKEILNEIAIDAGFKGASALQQAVFVTWTQNTVEIPPELVKLRKYVSSL